MPEEESIKSNLTTQRSEPSDTQQTMVASTGNRSLVRHYLTYTMVTPSLVEENMTINTYFHVSLATPEGMTNNWTVITIP